MLVDLNCKLNQFTYKAKPQISSYYWHYSRLDQRGRERSQGPKDHATKGPWGGARERGSVGSSPKQDMSKRERDNSSKINV